MSLVFGSASLTHTDGNEASGAEPSGSNGICPMDSDGTVPELATCVSSILPMLINAGMVDQQFAWPLLRVMSTPASSCAHMESAAMLLSLLHASNDQAKAAMDCTQQHGGHVLSESAVANIQAFMGGQLSKAGV